MGYGKTWLGRDLEWQIKNAGFDLGPFHIKTAFTLTNAGYDSNVYYGATDEPVKDITFTAGPAFNIYLPIKKKIIFSIYESPQYVYFKETTRERTWNNYFNGQVHFVFNKFLLTFGMGISEARERWNTEIDIRPRRREDAVQASLLWQVQKKTSFSFAYSQAKYDYENIAYEGFNLQRLLNREENYFNFAGFYQLSYRTRFFLELEYGYFNFDDPETLKNSEAYGAYGGFEFSPLGKIKGRIKIGYKFFNSLSPLREDYRGIVGDSSLSIRLLKPLSVRASYKRDVHFSVWYDNTFFLENRYGAGGSLYLFRNIRLDYDYFVGRNSYPEAYFGDGSAFSSFQKRQDDYRTHMVGLYFRLKKNIGLGVIASRWVRDSNLEWEDDERNFLGLNLTYDF